MGLNDLNKYRVHQIRSGSLQIYNIIMHYMRTEIGDGRWNIMYYENENRKHSRFNKHNGQIETQIH